MWANAQSDASLACIRGGKLLGIAGVSVPLPSGALISEPPRTNGKSCML